ncbi:unnamed protein product [Acanthoscelides obtectus]|uniref:Uncharacterized protein n=1 Tax=Acanthoscelides obtectus TaxID=200917 RepID=A0A9P0K641_ACAOB|nr:unnamed protein product [Acanthoscelides obtectus]CAK1658264.1 hypothetical protein AOBTE_LOCUS20791 [Acanthoscelides obtectus]
MVRGSDVPVPDPVNINAIEQFKLDHELKNKQEGIIRELTDEEVREFETIHDVKTVVGVAENMEKRQAFLAKKVSDVRNSVNNVQQAMIKDIALLE